MSYDDECFEYLEVMNSGEGLNEFIYNRLLVAIPEPQTEYCRWVIDQFLMKEFSLE